MVSSRFSSAHQPNGDGRVAAAADGSDDGVAATGDVEDYRIRGAEIQRGGKCRDCLIHLPDPELHETDNSLRTCTQAAQNRPVPDGHGHHRITSAYVSG